MRKLLHVLLLVGILGLWPLWFAVVWVVAAARRSVNPDYWSAAPWIIVVSIPVCVVTTILAFAANYIFHRSEGGPLRKSILAGLVYIGALVVLYAVSGVDWLREFGFKE
jgi:hypothetical protein